MPTTKPQSLGGEMYVAGSLDLTQRTSPICCFDDKIIDGLHSLSVLLFEGIRNKTLSREYLYFSQWSRKRNLLKLKSILESDRYMHVGRGLVLHIAPANVRANALFSLAFGLLGGNTNYLRISERQIEESQDINHALNKWLESDEFLAQRVRIGSYAHNSQLSEELSKLAAARIIWGGDKTIENIRSVRSSPMCIDVTFPNRVSYGLIHGAQLRLRTDEELSVLASRVARDIYMFDQLACSSPTVIFYVGSDKDDDARLKSFFGLVNSFMGSNGESASQALDHHKVASQMALEANGGVLYGGKYLLAIRRDNHNDGDIRIDLHKNGVISVVTIGRIKDIGDFLEGNAQTLVDFMGGSCDPDMFRALIESSSLTRIVDGGQALALESIWDGHDIVRMISRTIPIRSNA